MPDPVTDIHIRPATPEDIPAIVDIINDAIRNSTTLWETRETTVAVRLDWLRDSNAQGFPILVAVTPDGTVAGYCSWKTFRPFSGYAHTVEHSIYIAPAYKRRGIGSLLLGHLCDLARRSDVHVMVAAITASNTPSRLLHERFDFQPGGMIPQCGTKFGRWMDLMFLYKLVPND
ncbi:GNAT family N-acetyltransferase [Gluconacetobacter entanii]|uniref:GNAT family N-acetyltransferase n=1 Tax=Gluconacetobacter entanii TaxID=108528 RepID=A0A318PWU6_9PROT|nr:GNAT family N-acetyltransferase [Gluconacetobacter entanii]MBE7619998.1 GNAT family N-acetyltransferase [Komagataeibacter sp. FXV2]MCE2579988.1 N-acetyltransferase family protein [Komagataeibacter sp. FNDCR1]MBY4640242.1 GNAT family N-acetyltransferase [Gluconacetobacter entanii]MCW4582188.1 GNAT family N-acetyltransferase [Gluconacetobacter entanii]MCW4585453.1 GNAT family N-acetyltransferase [Gluconacetobacter entanii]